MTPPKLLTRFNWLEIALHGPIGILRGKKGRTMAQYYGGLLGPGNYARWLKPFLAAVPSQDADDFPAEGAGSLFKKRPRLEQYPRSYGFAGGLQTVCDAALRSPGIRVETGAEVVRLAPAADGFVATAADGRSFAAPAVALATPIDAAARALAADFPEIARVLGARTAEAGSPVQSGQIAFSLLAFVLTYFFIFGAGSYYIGRLIARGPDTKEQGFGAHGIQKPPIVADLVSKRGGKHV